VVEGCWGVPGLGAAEVEGLEDAHYGVSVVLFCFYLK